MRGDRIGNLDKCKHQKRFSSVHLKATKQNAAFKELMRVYYLFKSNRILQKVDLAMRENH